MQRHEADEVQPTDRWVELRVHGVSGSPPESMLLSAHVVQVAGDEKSRFFRPAGLQGQELPPDRGRVLEAYHWGRFTSGTWRQALWLLIIPFGILNSAQFMLPRPGGSPWARRWHAVSGAMLRVLGVGLTCLLIFSSAVVSIDLLGWQLAGAGQGAGRQWWLLAGLLLPLSALTPIQSVRPGHPDGRSEPGRGHPERTKGHDDRSRPHAGSSTDRPGPSRVLHRRSGCPGPETAARWNRPGNARCARVLPSSRRWRFGCSCRTMACGRSARGDLDGDSVPRGS